VTIEGADPTRTVINFGGVLVASGRVFHIAETGNVMLNGLTVQGGVAVNGGAIFNRGTLIVSETNNFAFFGIGGGAIYSVGSLTIVDSRVSNNRTSMAAGGGHRERRRIAASLTNTIDNNFGDLGAAALSRAASLRSRTVRLVTISRISPAWTCR
jgi:predicted outer membrane repeat protein